MSTGSGGTGAGQEPVRATSPVGPAVVAGLAMLLVHAAASAVLTSVAATATPGSGVAGRAWPVAVWALAVAVAGLAALPVLRRAGAPVRAGAGAGAVAAAAYALIAFGLTDAGATVPWVQARVATLVVAGGGAGWLTARRARVSMRAPRER